MKCATRIATLAAAALLTVSVSECSDDSSSGPSSSAGSSTGASPSSGGQHASSTPSGGNDSPGVDDAIAKVMASSADMPAIASSKGSLEAAVGTSSVRAEVLQVKSTAQATRVIWRLKSASGKSVATNTFQLSRPPLFDTRQLGIVDPKTKKTIHPFTYGEPQDLGCVCSTLPDSVKGDGVVLYAVLPPLPSGTSLVNVTLPGFKTMTGVQLTSS